LDNQKAAPPAMVSIAVLPQKSFDWVIFPDPF